MPGAALEFNRVGSIVLRSMRRPIMTLLWVYAIAVIGMTLIPGKEIDGEVQYMSIFHAFYFMTYTATTTGFGEIPYEFSNAQRMWAIVCLYVSVIAWFYAITSIVRLFQNPYYQQALAEKNFTRAVLRITDPFYILCGFGDTGSLLARGLSDAGIPAIVIEVDDERIKALSLRDYRVPMPGLCADAGVPKHLLEAGLTRPNCLGVIIVTSDEEANLKVSVIAHLLNPKAEIITMSKMDIYEERLATLGREVHIVDPFKTFAKGLAAAIFNPSLYILNRWLIGARGASLESSINPPYGKWIICGFGRLGNEINEALCSRGIPTIIIDPHPRPENCKAERYICGRTTSNTLVEAGIKDAAGILVGTDDDGHNLGIMINARSLNPEIFMIVRQNRHQNEVAFHAAQADIIMQPSLVTARRIVFALIAPLLRPLFRYLMDAETRDDNLTEGLIDRLQESIGVGKPHLMTIEINDKTSPAVIQVIEDGQRVLLGDVLRDPANREDQLASVPLVVHSADQFTVLPSNAYPLKNNDQILFCGKEAAHNLLRSNLYNEYALDYVRRGAEPARGWIMQWIEKRRQQAADSKSRQ